MRPRLASRFHLETRRKTLHGIFRIALAGIVYFLPIELSFLVLGVIALITIAFARLVKKGHNIPLVSYVVELTERKGKSPAYGVLWYFLGVLSTIIAFGLIAHVQKEIIVAAMLIVAIGDSVSTGLGRIVGKRRMPKTITKTYEGTGYGFAFAFLGASIVLMQAYSLPFALVEAAIGAGVGMLAEAYIRALNDNFTIPILSCAAMVLANSILVLL
jgi:dolichol kinase